MSIEADPSAVTAIDILLEPDATMLRHARVVNGVCSAFSRRALRWTPHIALTSPWCGVSSSLRILTRCMAPSARSSPVPM